MALHAAWWWIDRWRKSTAYTDMTLAEQGAYRNLLDELWLRNGFLPDNDRILGKIAGDFSQWPKVRKAVMARFDKTPHGWKNDTHDQVAGASKSRADRQARYRERLANDRNEGHNADHNEPRNNDHNKGRSPSPSPSPSLNPSVLLNKKDQNAPQKARRNGGSNGISPKTIGALVAHLVKAHPDDGFVDLKDMAKEQCAKHHLEYDATAVSDAIEQALARRRK